MKIGCLEQLLSHGFACSAFEQNIVRYDDCRFAGRLQHRLDVLYEVELFVTGCSPKVLAVVREVFFFLFALLVSERLATLLSKWWIREDIINSFSGRSNQCIRRRDKTVAGNITDVMQEQVHQR